MLKLKNAKFLKFLFKWARSDYLEYSMETLRSGDISPRNEKGIALDLEIIIQYGPVMPTSPASMCTSSYVVCDHCTSLVLEPGAL
jgi:hypothetical protein